ncbi:MAG: hypothetical protein ACLU9S_01125 [Oscillospiraceae bacterium]
MVNHPSFAALPEDKLTEDSMTQESVDAIWDTLNASQTYFRNSSYYNSKLPFIFNYDGLNFDVSAPQRAMTTAPTLPVLPPPTRRIPPAWWAWLRMHSWW